MRSKIHFTAIMCIFLVALSYKLEAQTTDFNGLNIKSPDVATLGKFGAYPVSYYTGTPNISIPLYTYKDKDFEIPVSIDYDASGFIPNREPGVVGQNWILNAGGIITRTIVGIPDEQSGCFTTTNDIQKYGYWYGINHMPPPLTADSIKYLSYFTNTAFGPDLHYEHTPDIFDFNFLGHHGKFLIGNDGAIKVISDKSYKIDLTSLVSQSPDNDLDPSSKITILSDDGYEFTFGGNLSSIEVNLVIYNPGPTLEVGKRGVINAWYLTKITSPTGQTIQFNYETQVLNSQTSEDKDFFQKVYYYNDQQKGCSSSCEPGCGQSNFDLKLNIIKLVRLVSITAPSGTIEFTYSGKEHPFYNNLAGLLPFVFKLDTKKLDNIKVFNNNVFNNKDVLIKTVAFNYKYNYSSNDSYRLFLDNLIVNDQEKYSFDYYYDSQLPYFLTKKIDLWGYYNGNNLNQLLPTGNLESGPFNVDFSHRSANTSYCKFGLLNTIHYPTGGNTVFDYEGNEYGTILKRTGNPWAGIYPTVLYETGYVGGARISSITNSSGEVHHFYYKNDYSLSNPSGSSSGVATDFSVYYVSLSYYFNPDCQIVHHFLVNSDNIISATSIHEPTIGYKEVTEVVNDGSNGYTKYIYTNHLTNPDIYTLGAGTYTIKNDGLLNNDFTAQMNRLFKYSSCESERGKLVNKLYYNSNDQLIRNESLSYNTDPNRYSNAVISYNWPFWDTDWGMYHSYAVYCFPNLLSEKTITQYDKNGENPIIEQEGYEYNSNNLLKTTITQESNGTEKTVRYKYPIDYTLPENVTLTEETDAIRSLQKTNNISQVIEQQTFLRTGLTTKLLNGKLVKYKDFRPGILQADLVKPKEEYTLESSEPTTDLTESSIGTGNTLVYHPDYKRIIVYDSYDEEGNLLQFHKENDINNSILWSYNKSLPVASIKNVGNSLAYSTTIETSNGTLPYDVSTTGTISSEFTSNVTENITIAINYGGSPGVDKVSNFHYILTGPSSSSNDLCVCSLSGGCSGFSNSITLSNMPAGTYTLSVSPNTNNANCRVNITYQYKNEVTTSTLSTEVYHQGFEEFEGATSASSTVPAYTGKFYKYGTFTIPFSIPNGKSYIVEYHYWNGSNWIYVKEPFTSYMTLSDGSAIDDIRVHPSDAQMTTYTYDPLIGMTSSTDENNITTYYEYDAFGRLKCIKDQDKNIVKMYDYHYQEQ